MADREPQSTEPEELRRRAEAHLRETREAKESPISDVDAQSLVHELQVHQIELEMQNEELRRARVETEDALERYTDLYDFAPIGYFTLDERGHIIETNLAGGGLLGMDRVDLANANFRFFLARESLKVFQEFLSRLFASQQRQVCEVQLRHGVEPGRYVRIEGAFARAAEDGSILCRAAVIDITERKHAEQELLEAREESERRAAEMQSFLASMGDGVLMVDLNGDVIYANEAAFEILGAPEDETFDDWMRQYARYTLDGRPFPLEDLATARAIRGQIVKEQRVRVVSPRGKEMILGNGAAPVRDAGGAVIGAITVFRDIRRRVEFEEDRQVLLEREHRIAEVLQQALIPVQREYQKDRCRVAVSYLPASEEAEIGGDFFDVFELDQGKQALVVGDITGKGLIAAFRVAAARHSIRSYAYLDASPAAIMTRVNDALCREPEETTAMLTAFLGIMDKAGGNVTFTSAGHEPPFLRDGKGNVTHPDLTGRALGVMGGYAYPETSVQLQPGDLLVVVTDGITEARCQKRDFFGREGVAEFLAGAPLDDPPEAITAGLLEAAKSHAEGRLRDDAVIMAIQIV